MDADNARPFIEHRLGRLQHHHEVDRGPAADGAALKDAHGGVGRRAHRLVGVQARHHVAFDLVEVWSVQVFAFLEDHYLAPRFGESCGRHRATSADFL